MAKRWQKHTPKGKKLPKKKKKKVKTTGTPYAREMDYKKSACAKLAEMVLDIEKGDTILTGRFKNSPQEVKSFGTDANGQPTINGRKVLTFRINKLMPKEKQVKKSACAKLAALGTDKTAANDYVRDEIMPIVAGGLGIGLGGHEVYRAATGTNSSRLKNILYGALGGAMMGAGGSGLYHTATEKNRGHRFSRSRGGIPRYLGSNLPSLWPIAAGAGLGGLAGGLATPSNENDEDNTVRSDEKKKQVKKSACAKLAALVPDITKPVNPTPGQQVLSAGSPNLLKKPPTAPNTTFNVSGKAAPEAIGAASAGSVGSPLGATDSPLTSKSAAFQLGVIATAGFGKEAGWWDSIKRWWQSQSGSLGGIPKKKNPGRWAQLPQKATPVPSGVQNPTMIPGAPA
ncbi:MAG TPA: hypothetical protein ENH11_09340 [Candidatus Acetothermia bacterium]|nr:hypothetical protein [Candidatus Acetothermia bacterium]